MSNTRRLLLLCAASFPAADASCISWCNPRTKTSPDCSTCDCGEAEAFVATAADKTPPPCRAASRTNADGSLHIWDGSGEAPPFTNDGHGVRPGTAFGPVPQRGHPQAGWVNDLGFTEVSEGAVRIGNNARVYLVEDYRAAGWEEHRYLRIDLQKAPLRFTLDLSTVPCGCLATVYLVAMKDPANGRSSYCDMAPDVTRHEKIVPGYGESVCTELDILCARGR